MARSRLQQQARRKSRRAARGEILGKVNDGCVFNTTPKLYRRHIQRAVFVARQRGHVSSDLLAIAGFRSRGSR